MDERRSERSERRIFVFAQCRQPLESRGEFLRIGACKEFESTVKLTDLPENFCSHERSAWVIGINVRQDLQQSVYVCASHGGYLRQIGRGWL
jgi:hypothetical protein